MAELKWKFPPDIPTEDLLDASRLSRPGHVGMVIDDLIWMIEKKEFHTWEAVVRQEQGLPLSAEQRKLLDQLIDFSDEDEERILYIDEMPRPSEPWYKTIRKIAPHLLAEPFRTYDIHTEGVTRDWPRLAEAIEKHATGLSLPKGVTSPIEVVPADLRHRLWLQTCFDALDGLGQDAKLTLGDARQQRRIDHFVKALRAHRDSVARLALTLDSLLQRIILPEGDVPLFVALMQEKLGLASSREPLAAHL